MNDLTKIPKKAKVAIFTNFMDVNPGYSLTGIVIDQARMLLMNGHKVTLFVNEQFNYKFNEVSGLSDLLEKYKETFLLLEATKFAKLDDYQSSFDLSEEHKDFIEKATKTYLDIFSHFGTPDVIFTHDFIFTGWNLPYAKAIQNLSKKLLKVKWFHWVHSIPSGTRDWWDLSIYGPQHKIIFPNKTDQNYIAQSFKTSIKNIISIPHIKDIRSWYDMSDAVWEISERFPNLLLADIIQIYPASSDRLHAKQVDILIKMFGFFKKSHSTVFLLIANQWATGLQRKEELNKYIDIGIQYGLEYGVDFIFSSEIKSEYEIGLPKRVIQELQLFQNLFIFPTQAESFGLIGPEAALSGSMVITNRSLTMMKEVMGHYSTSYDFGSYHQETPQVKDDEYLYAVAMNILDLILNDSSLKTKAYVRKRYNMIHLYNFFYAPLIQSFDLDNVS